MHGPGLLKSERHKLQVLRSASGTKLRSWPSVCLSLSYMIIINLGTNVFRTVPISVTTDDVAMRITFCLSLAYLTAIWTAQTIQCLMMSLVVNNEVGGMWKESVVIQLQVLCGHLLRPRHITSLVEGRASLQGAWPTAPRRSVVMNSNITTAIL